MCLQPSVQSEVMRLLRELWQTLPGTCVAVAVIASSFLAWAICCLFIRDITAIIGLVVWLFVAAVAMQLGVKHDNLGAK